VRGAESDGNADDKSENQQNNAFVRASFVSSCLPCNCHARLIIDLIEARGEDMQGIALHANRTMLAYRTQARAEALSALLASCLTRLLFVVYSALHAGITACWERAGKQDRRARLVHLHKIDLLRGERPEHRRRGSRSEHRRAACRLLGQPRLQPRQAQP
jgi:hypothetical protein